MTALGSTLSGVTRRAGAALRDFLRGFTGLAGAGVPDLRPGRDDPGAPAGTEGADAARGARGGGAPTPAAVRRALRERAARRRSCC